MFATFLVPLFLVSSASAAVHHLFVGTFSNAVLYTLEFDDEALTLQLVQNNSASTSHSWIAFDHTKSNVYGVAGTAVASYSVQSGTSLRFDASIETGGNCTALFNLFGSLLMPPRLERAQYLRHRSPGTPLYCLCHSLRRRCSMWSCPWCIFKRYSFWSCPELHVLDNFRCPWACLQLKPDIPLLRRRLSQLVMDAQR